MPDAGDEGTEAGTAPTVLAFGFVVVLLVIAAGIRAATCGGIVRVHAD